MTLKIIIFDGSLKATTFINRLAKGLSVKHEVYMLGFDVIPENKILGVHYKSLGSSQKPLALFMKSFKYALKATYSNASLKPLKTFFKAIFSNNRNALKQANLEVAIRAISPDILHLQWLSLLPYLESRNSLSFRERTHFKGKILLSQRGFQSNVRPFIDATNLSYLQKMYPLIDGFHSVSKEMSHTGNLVYTSPKKIDEIIYSGFDLKALPFSETYHKNPKTAWLSIGRPHWIKGYAYAIEACSMLKTAGYLFSYTIVGAENNEELCYLINAHGLEKEIILTKKIPQREVYNLMGKADALLFPSLKEGLPNVVVEAMAIGLPIVATDCGGVRELLGADLGIVTPTRDATLLFEAMVSFSEMPLTSIVAQREKARKKVLHQHNSKKMVTDMEALYVKCLQS